MYNIPNINAYNADAILNIIGSFLLHFIDNDNAKRLVKNKSNKNINKNDFNIYFDNASKNLPKKFLSFISFIKYILDFIYLFFMKI